MENSIPPINQLTNQPINYTVEGDWSGAAFLLVAGAIAGNIVVKGLDGYIVAEFDNVLMICKKEDEQKVKEFVASAGTRGKEFV